MHNIWPTERRRVFQRYIDAPAAALLVPTLPAFAAAKTATWADRHAADDLCDLWSRSALGAVDAAAAVLFRRYGPTNRTPAPHMFSRVPSEAQWQAQLAGQTRLTVSANDALEAVRGAWQKAAGAAPTLNSDE